MADKQYKIMMVDDDQFLLDMYAQKFKSAGHEIEAMLDPEVALNKLREGLTVDAIILDAVMPGINGLELLKTIHDEHLGGSPVLIMLTNQSQKQDVEEARDIGVDGYIVKADNVPSEVIHKALAILAEKKP